MLRPSARRRSRALTLLALPVAIATLLAVSALHGSPMIEPTLLLLVLAGASARLGRRIASLAKHLLNGRLLNGRLLNGGPSGTTSPPLDEARLIARLSRLCSQDRDPTRLVRLVTHLCHEAGLPEIVTARFATASSLYGLGRLLSPVPLDRAAEGHLARRVLANGGAIAACAGEMACFHQARWDGDGSLHEVAGEAIPLSARLLSVVLAFDLALPAHLPLDAASVQQAIFAALVPVLAEGGHALDPTLTVLLLGRSDALLRAVQPTVRPHPIPVRGLVHVPRFSPA